MSEKSRIAKAGQDLFKRRKDSKNQPRQVRKGYLIWLYKEAPPPTPPF